MIIIIIDCTQGLLPSLVHSSGLCPHHEANCVRFPGFSPLSVPMPCCLSVAVNSLQSPDVRYTVSATTSSPATQ